MSAFRPLGALAPAKINLGLFVGPTLADGRHQLVSVMQSISLADRLTLEPEVDAQGDRLVCPGVDGEAEENLAMRALTAFREATGWDEKPLRLTVEKRVPVAAGLGGGSGDAAAVLRLAAAASRLGEKDLLLELAAGLGADVPAQVRPGRWLARGVGERLLPLPDAERPFGVLVLPAGEPLSTAAVYAELDRGGELRERDELARLAAKLERAFADGEPLSDVGLLHNDLQAPALTLCPAIAPLLERAQEAGADHAILSGSGPTVLGLYRGADGLAMAADAARRLNEEGIAALAATPVAAGFGEPSPVTQQ